MGEGDRAKDVEEQPLAGWSVWRQDDNGNRFSIRAGLTREEAEQMCRDFEARGHKQLYWVAPDGASAVG